MVYVLIGIILHASGGGLGHAMLRRRNIQVEHGQAVACTELACHMTSQPDDRSLWDPAALAIPSAFHAIPFCTILVIELVVWT